MPICAITVPMERSGPSGKEHPIPPVKRMQAQIVFPSTLTVYVSTRKPPVFRPRDTFKEDAEADTTHDSHERNIDIELANLKGRLEEAHTALGVLLERYHEDRVQLREGVVLNVRETIVPYLEKLKGTQLNQTQTEYIDIIQRGLADIVSPFATRMSSRTLNLTPREIEIAYLIREGRTTKQIAEILHLSLRAVDTHRYNLRRKLGIGAKKINLRAQLLSVAEIQDFGSLPASFLAGTYGLKDSARPANVFNRKCKTPRLS
jgi:DNA-binding CsgD family transcriptional regulator